MKTRPYPVLFMISLVFVGGFLASLHIQAAEAPRGGKVQWARLLTNYQHWARHTETEYFLLEYIRDNTTLDIDPRWAIADINKMESLSRYPFVYAEGIQTVTEPVPQANLREYMLRGGFLLIDACINVAVNPEPDVFLADQLKRMKEILTEAKITPIPPHHEIFKTYFELERRPQSFMNNVFDPRWEKIPMYAVELDGRVVSIISLSALKCGWSFDVNPPQHRINSMKMMINIYAFSLIH